MFSVEDLLISHGYKAPKHSTTPTPTSTSCHTPSCFPPSYSKHQDTLEKRPPSRTLNGYEMGHMVATYGNSSGSRQHQGYGGAINANANRVRKQPTHESDPRSQTNLLTSDSGFCDGTRAAQSQSKNVSYWRRKGQDFTVLLDYAGVQEAPGGEQGDYRRPQEAQQARGQEPSAEDFQSSSQERRRWAAHAPVPVPAPVHTQAQARAWTRKREAALHQWRTMAERKCQSLGTDVWHPAVNFSHSEGDHRALEQQRLHAGTPDGLLARPSNKAKFHSLPRMLQPESLHYVDITPSGQELYRRFNGHPLIHSDLYRTPYWPEKSRPASANQLLIMPKPRFTRPPRPPSYEMHQQIRGSCEVLSGRESVLSQVRDRTPLPISRAADPHQMDYYAQDSGPPGYIPPPSYKRAPAMTGRRGYGEILVDYRYRGDMYPQIQVAPDGSHWLTRHPAGSWPVPQRERKQHNPMYSSQQHSWEGVQYVPFDDTRIRHLSPALGGSSLTDADKIRQFRNELPCAAVTKPTHNDSAFLPPPLGPFITPKLANDANPMSSRNNDNNRYYSNLHKENVDNFPAHDQNCNNRCPPKHYPSLRPSSAFQATIPRCDFHHSSMSEPFSAETITHVKQIAPDAAADSYRNTKRRVSETIFCLVSVPVHTPTNMKKDLAADQNNNDTVSNLTISNSAQHFAVCLKESLNIRSKSVNEMPIKSNHPHLYNSSTLSLKDYKRAPLRKEIIDAWARQANEDKKLWPGNQYRNQETQTGSPVTEVKSPEPQSPPVGKDPVQSATDTTTDSGAGLSCSSSYGYPMTGQKHLNTSSNSAFSRLSLTQSSPLQPIPDLSSPSNGNIGVHQPSSPGKSNCSFLQSEDQKAFGQFLLKPVNRRPCDAIDVLENINKVMEDTISKRPIVIYSLDDIDGMRKKRVLNKSRSHVSVVLEPGRDAISLPQMHTEKHINIKTRSKSFNTTVDLLDSSTFRSAFPKPQSETEVSLLSKYNILNNYHSSQDPQQKESDYFSRQDIPVAQESLLRDVGLTVYTETLDGSADSRHRSLSIPFTRNSKDHNQLDKLSNKTREALVEFGGCPEHNSNKKFGAVPMRKRISKSDTCIATSRKGFCRSRSEIISSHLTDSSSNLKSQVSVMFEENNGDKNYITTEPMTYKNDSAIADQHLENLLSFDQANALPTEDLSNLYEVKCAKGIPENESIEKRAARILGIAVEIEVLGGTAKEADNSAETEDDRVQGQSEETKQVLSEDEQIRDEALLVQKEDEVEDEKTKSVENHTDNDTVDKQNQISDQSHGTEDQEAELNLNLDLPEFSSSELPLSVPVNEQDKTLQNKYNQQDKVQVGPHNPTDNLQVKESCSSSSSSTSNHENSTKEGMGDLKALDTESQKDNFSLKGQVEECKVKETEVQIGDKDQITDGHENEKEMDDQMDNRLENCKPEKQNVHEEERLVEEFGRINEVIALRRDNQQSTDVDVKLKTKDPLNNLEESKESLEQGGGKQKVGGGLPVPRRRDADLGNLPKPKQRTKLPKPPLLPKPQSVPKRGLKRPVSLTAATCAPANMEDDKRLSASDYYDPSQVEQV